MIKYAPYIDGTIPAFTADGGIKVPFQPNLAVGEDAAAGMVLMIKDLNGNILEYKESTRIENNIAEFTNSNLITLRFQEDYTIRLGDNSVSIFGPVKGEYIINKKETSSFSIANKNLTYKISPFDKSLISRITLGNNVNVDDNANIIIKNFEVGQYYKVQLAYKDKDTIKENYSKLTYSSVGVTKYIGVVSHYFNEEDNSFRFECEDSTETIFKNEEKVFLDNVEINNQTLLRNGFTYTRINVITTINNYVSKLEYTFTKRENTPSNLPNIKISKNYEYGEIILPPLNDPTLKYIRVNSIYDKNYSLVSSLDNTVEHGKNYYYGIINNNGDWLLNTTDSIIPYFEDMFLQDATHSLRIKFNPKVSSFKKTIQESKVDTLGSQYPYFFRNGDMDYAEFPISGLLSYWMGDSGKFGYDWEYGIIKHFEGNRGEEATVVVSQNLSVFEANFNDNGTLTVDDEIRPGRTTNLVNYNIAAERIYKMKVLEWLNNGQPKLFRSPTEGNFVVRLMNVSLSPEERLGRMLHSFNCTAYECAAADYETLVSLHLVPGSEAEK